MVYSEHTITLRFCVKYELIFSNNEYNTLNYTGETNSEKVKMSDYEIRRPSHVKDIANIIHKMLFLHAKVNISKLYVVI